MEQKWQLLLQTDIFIPAAICYHILLEKRPCCFHLAGPGEPCSQGWCVLQVKLALPGHWGWGWAVLSPGSPGNSTHFFSHRQYYNNYKIRRWALCKDRLCRYGSYSVRITVHRICVSLVSPSFAEMKCPHPLAWFSWFPLRKHCLSIALSFATNSLFNKWAASIFVNLQLCWP